MHASARSSLQAGRPSRAALLGVAGSLLMFLGDMFLYGSPHTVSVTVQGIVEGMRQMDAWRLKAGGWLGPLASVLYCCGFHAVRMRMGNGRTPLAKAVFALFCTAMIYGGAYHSQYPYLGFGIGGHAAEEYLGLMTVGAVVPMAVASLLLLWAILARRTDYPRAAALATPLPLVLLGQVWALLPYPLLVVLGGGWNNLLFTVFFLLTAYLPPASGSGQIASGASGRPRSLLDVPPGGTARVLCVQCTGRAADRLAALGLLAGCPVRMHRNGTSGPLVVEFMGTFLGMARTTAGHIVVDGTGRERT